MKAILAIVRSNAVLLEGLPASTTAAKSKAEVINLYGERLEQTCEETPIQSMLRDRPLRQLR